MMIPYHDQSYQKSKSIQTREGNMKQKEYLWIKNRWVAPRTLLFDKSLDRDVDNDNLANRAKKPFYLTHD